jgi:hypothetical protein
MTVTLDRALIQQHWPKLTPDDLQRIGSDREELVRAIEDRYVCSNLEAEEQVVALEDDDYDDEARQQLMRGS